MQSAIQKSLLQQLIGQRNGYLVLSAGLVALCLLLTVGLFRAIERERIVIVPPVVNEAFWVEAKALSPEYLSQMTVFFAQLRLSVTPSSAGYQRELLLRYVDPSYYGALKSSLVREADQLTQTHTSTTFYPVSVSVDPHHFTAKITGDLSAMVGNAPLPVQRLTYRLAYRYAQGRLWLQSFQEEENAHESHAQNKSDQ